VSDPGDCARRAGAVVERMGGLGTVVAAHIGEREPGYAINDMVNRRGTSKVLLTARLTDLITLAEKDQSRVSHLRSSPPLPPPGSKLTLKYAVLFV
jgi:hypothetical protein